MNQRARSVCAASLPLAQEEEEEEVKSESEDKCKAETAAAATAKTVSTSILGVLQCGTTLDNAANSQPHCQTHPRIFYFFQLANLCCLLPIDDLEDIPQTKYHF